MRRTEFRALGGSRVYKGAIRGKEIGNPGSDVANKRDVRVGRRWRADAERMHAGLGANVGDDRARSLRPRVRQLRQASLQRA